jgi:hypothetical protein
MPLGFMPNEKHLVFAVTTADSGILSDLLDGKNVKFLTDGLTLKSGGMTIHEVVGFPETYTFLVYLAENLAVPFAVGLLTNYIYDKVKPKQDAKLKIGNVDVRIEKGEIERAILEHLDKESKLAPNEPVDYAPLATMYSAFMNHYLHQDRLVWSRTEFLIAFQGLVIVAVSNLRAGIPMYQLLDGAIMIFGLWLTLLIALVSYKDLRDRDSNLKRLDNLRDDLGKVFADIRDFRMTSQHSFIHGSDMLLLIFISFGLADLILAILFFSRWM